MAVSLKDNLVKIVLKVFQLACVIAAISLYIANYLIVTSKDSLLGTTFFCDGSLFMAIVVTPLLLVFNLLGQGKDSLFETTINFFMGIFLIATGGIVISTYTDTMLWSYPTIRAKGLAFGSMCIVGAAFYLGDGVFSFIKYKKAV